MLVKDKDLLAFLVEEPKLCPSSSGSKDLEKSLGVESNCSPAVRNKYKKLIHLLPYIYSIFIALKNQFIMENPQRTLENICRLFYLTNGIA